MERQGRGKRPSNAMSVRFFMNWRLQWESNQSQGVRHSSTIIPTRQFDNCLDDQDEQKYLGPQEVMAADPSFVWSRQVPPPSSTLAWGCLFVENNKRSRKSSALDNSLIKIRLLCSTQQSLILDVKYSACTITANYCNGESCGEAMNECDDGLRSAQSSHCRVVKCQRVSRAPDADCYWRGYFSSTDTTFMS